LIIFDIVLSYIPQARSQTWAQQLHKIADAPQKPIRDMLPRDIPFDPSPMIVIILIQVLMYII
jgi:YggT family protein